MKGEGTVEAGCMRQGIRGTTINTRIKRNDVNEENTNQTHVKQHARGKQPVDVK